MPRILMIDDDKDLLVVTKSFLQRKGFDIAACASWEEASAELKRFNPQLIIIDVFLEELDGFQICKKLKSSPFTRHIPILVLSGYPRLAETAIYEFGADEFVSKPFEINELIEKIHDILGKHQQSV